MAAIGFSVDLRGQLLSHGLGGVQAVHYDKHSYLPKKTAALEKWEHHLGGPGTRQGGQHHRPVPPHGLIAR